MHSIREFARNGKALPNSCTKKVYAETGADDNACANCGKGEEKIGHLKACVACKMVKYCNRECQIAHRPQHKKACKKRADELRDEALFKEIPPTEDCPICMLPLPHDPMQSCFRSCCGKRICNGCIVAMMVQGKSKDSARCCPFCRKLAARDRDGSEVTLLEKLIESCNGEACMQLGSFIAQGDFGLEVDNVKATELFLKAGKLGYTGGYFNLGEFYRAVEVDEKKAKHYYELAAIGGNVYARHNLGSIELPLIEQPSIL